MAELDGLVAAWAAGDVEMAGELMNRSMKRFPTTQRLILTDRNRRWADAIVRRMEQPGTVFVAVGTGHLVGTESLLAILADRGLEAARVPY
jgi:uncharacterized protein YbaP (TraB family)